MMGNYSSALIPDTEDFVSITSVAEKLNDGDSLQSELQTLVTHFMEEERNKKTTEEMNSSVVPGNTEETRAAQAKSESFSSLLPKALSAALRSATPPGPSTECQGKQHISPNMEQLQTELRDLREQFVQMKSQHNKEIKLLMNELDEEKRIRLTLQMEIQRMKKHMSK
ncbi:SH3 domain-containing kinase-binding protein 1 [Gouania willdenowi]|uniref:SH3 domain-containing kinase-binding protein 1 n=1 Tax=Gouania willdenowi TaxID=441366 RepID=UPI001054B9B7|nr:SH3 domain-containing kinase-binding protein 1-like [Gouania willdenowi]